MIHKGVEYKRKEVQGNNCEECEFSIRHTLLDKDGHGCELVGKPDSEENMCCDLKENKYWVFVKA